MHNGNGVIRVGGVGTGRIFQHAHLAPYLRIMDKARLVGFYDAVPERAAAARDRYARTLEAFAEEKPQYADHVRDNLAQLRVGETLDQVLEGVDLIDICTTTQGRMESALCALEKGVHAMGEKPMARTWISADRAAHAYGRRPDVFFQLNDDNAFDPKYLAVGDLIKTGAIGRPQSIWIIRGSMLNSKNVLKSQANALSNGGGCLMDYGAHGLAGIWAALGRNYRFTLVDAVDISVRFPNRVLENDPYIMEVDDNARFKVLLEDIDTGSWVTVYMEATWCGGHIGPRDMRQDTGGCPLFRIEGDEGVLDATPHNEIVVTRWDGGRTAYPLRTMPGETVSFNDEIETMVDCVRAGRRPEVDVTFGAEIIAVCGAAYYSAIEKRAVTLEEFKEFCRSYMEKYGDNEDAERALLEHLMKPFAWKGGER